MRKYTHEIRDPIHSFIHLDTDERKVLDSRPFQRLRHIHQLALTYLVYPGATHKRFEHSLGVMELAGRVYDVITDPEHIHHDVVRSIIPKHDSDEHRYYRRVLRMAALCHDVGHLPFSHAAEADLLPDKMSHEDLTAFLIQSDEMMEIWTSMRPPLVPDDIIKLALGKKKLRGTEFNLWEAILSEIIVGNAFGVDRMDYLIRDSYHAGVGYGRFDYHRLVETLRMLPASDDVSAGQEPCLGIEEGGLRSAEALLIARYFIFSEVYLHPVRRIYDKHLKDFMIRKFGPYSYPVALEDHLRQDDNTLLHDIQAAANDPAHRAYDPARRICRREHFRLVYTGNASDLRTNPKAGDYVAGRLRQRFGEEAVWYDRSDPSASAQPFPVLMRDGRVINSTALSSVMAEGLVNSFDLVFVDPLHADSAGRHVKQNLRDVITPREEE